MSGWFDDQLKARIKSDEDAFSGAFNDISEAVSGHRIFEEIKENEIANAGDAIEEIARWFDLNDEVLSKQAAKEGETLDERLENVFGTFGIMRREVNLREDWYKDASGIYLGQTTEGKYVALTPDYHGYSYKDYVTGKRVRINSSTQKNLKPQAFCFYNPLPPEKLGIKDLVKFVLKSLAISDFVYIGLITLCVTLISMVAPFLMKIVYSQTIFSGNFNGLIAIFVFIILAGVSTTLLQIARSLIISRIEIKASVSINAAVMMRVINLPAEFFKNYSSGELAQRAMSVNMLCTSFVNVVFSVGLTALMSLIYLRQIFAFTPVLVWPALWIMAALVASSLIVTWGYSGLTKITMKLHAREYGLLFTFITGIQKIKLSGAERRAFGKWASHYKDMAKLRYNPPLYLKLAQVYQPVITLIGTFVLYWYAFKAGTSVEDYMAFMASYSLMSAAFVGLCAQTQLMATISPLIDMVRPILEAVPEVSHGKILKQFMPSIELQNVKFRYNDKTPFILDGISFKVNSGEYVAIVGKSGCGKSTLMRLLLGFERPNNGVIYYGHNDLKTINPKSIRSQIGCVMQNSNLFPGSIFSNITVSAPQLTEKEAWEAAELAGIADDIRKMPMGMHTLISEGASTLSGGQRQRIIIARAIAPKPKILFFDEATSALDNITQKIVSDSLEKLKCTRIVIAHRLSTIKRCNRILVIDGGKIVEEGTYDELINNKGLFASLVERQQLGETV
ncbi:MAG: ATP-binding cassette domain-containing protein [Synergistaceae bacterium]|nr:ATP-binding cassette domain-containing protein [Synergistaceae bacterium]